MIARTLLAAALLTCATSAFAQEKSQERNQDKSDVIASPVLRANVVVTTDIVRIGDVIDNAGSAGKIAIYRAPEPGTTGTLPVAQVINTLRSHQVIGVDIGGGVKTVGTPRLMGQGTLQPTGNELDIAIRGEGFFKIQMPDGTYTYTRDGSFMMDAQGRIVTAHGNPVQPTLTLPQNSSGLTINAQGQVSVTLPGSTTPTTVGQIGLTRFINKTGLQPIGDNLFTETPASGAPQDGVANADGFGDLQQGNLEQANVEAVSEISDLIAAQRAYEMNSKVISASDQMLQAASNLMR